MHHGGNTYLAPVQRGRLLPKPISYSPTHSISSLVNLFEQFTNLTGNVHCNSIANSLFPVHKSGGLPVRRFGKKVGSVLTGRSPRDCFPRFPPCFPYTMPSSHFLKTVFKFIIMPVDDVDYTIARDKVKTLQELDNVQLCETQA